MEVTLYKQDGTQSGTINLPEELFGVSMNEGLVHEVLMAQEANARVILSNTKDRSEVRGGGKKPWKQKGTGRARHGSRRSPIWVGGGITFGPTLFRNFGKKINKKAKRKALSIVLSDKVREGLFVAVENVTLPEAKTKYVSALRTKLPGANDTALVVITKEDQDFYRAARNIPKMDTILATSLNVKDLLKYTYLIASKDAVEQIKTTYAK